MLPNHAEHLKYLKVSRDTRANLTGGISSFSEFSVETWLIVSGTILSVLLNASGTNVSGGSPLFAVLFSENLFLSFAPVIYEHVKMVQMLTYGKYHHRNILPHSQKYSAGQYSLHNFFFTRNAYQKIPGYVTVVDCVYFRKNYSRNTNNTNNTTKYNIHKTRSAF